MKRTHRRAKRVFSTQADALEPRQLLTGLDFGDATMSTTAGLIAGPELQGLAVTGEGIDVYPAFSPDVLRYSVNPTEATSGITISPSADAGDQVTVNGRLLEPGESAIVTDIVEGETISVEVSNDSTGTRTYELYYLPVDFPLNVLTNNTAATGDGSVYMTPRAQTGTGYITKIDANGVPLFVKTVSGSRTFDFKLHDNGLYTYAIEKGFNATGRRDFDIVILDHEFNELKRVNTVGPDMNHTDFHDFQFTPDGDYVFLSYNGITRDGVFYEDSIVQVVDHVTGEEKFKWNSWDAVTIEDDVLGGTDRLPEWAHINSVFMDDNGDFLVSLRWTSSILKFDGETGETIWNLGGLNSDFEIDDPWGGPCGQHTAQYLPNGNLVFYDNGTPCPDLPEYEGRPEGRRMRYVEYALDENAMTAELVREIIHPDYPVGPTGSVQVLDNGNRFVSWGLPGQNFSAYSAAEYDENDEIVREYSLDGRGTVFFSYRAWYAEDPTYPTLAADNGASHTIVPGMYLGSGVDEDPDGQPSATDGDDVDVFYPDSGNIGDDEDGVTFVNSVVPGRLAKINVNASTTGLLNAWVDFNHDGDWNDAGEQVFEDTALSAGDQQLSFFVPTDARMTTTFSRFRFSTQAGLSPEGNAVDGEVEDHPVSITNLPAQVITDANGSVADEFGGDVAVSGRYAAVASQFGGPQDSGSVNVYNRTGPNTWDHVTEITAPNLSNNVGGRDWFGFSVAMHGTTLVVGAPLEEDGSADKTSGAAYVFEKDAGGVDNWGQVQRLRAADFAKGDQFGNAVSVADDTIVVGSRLDDGPLLKNIGSVYIFEENSSGVWQQQSRIADESLIRNDQFGYSLDIDGDNLIVGAPRVAAQADGKRYKNSGAVYIYNRDETEWNLQRRHDAPNLDNNVSAGDRFGESVAIHRSLAVVGAFDEENAGRDLSSGAAYVLRKNAEAPNTWAITTELKGADSAIRDHFGYDVDLRSNRIVVGARTKETDGGIRKAGAVFVFERLGDTDQWDEVAKYEAPDASRQDNMGTSVAMTRRYAFAGAPLSDPAGRSSGKAYSFYTAWSNPLLVSGAPVGFESGQRLTGTELQPVVDAAIEHWRNTPLTTKQRRALENLTVSVGNLRPGRLGEATGTSVLFDDNAAGFGWYVDQTPMDLTDDVVGARVDLMTVVLHEIGHVIGHNDTYRRAEQSDIMYGYLEPGERRSLNPADVLDDLDSVHASLETDFDAL